VLGLTACAATPGNPAGGASGGGTTGSTAGAGGTGVAATGGLGGVGGSSGVGGAGGSSGLGGFGAIGGGGAGGNFGVDGGPGCDTDLVITVRDFTETHPDFESFVGPQLDGIVAADLGADNRPVYAHPAGTACTTGPNEFAQWYHDVDGVNQRVPVAIQFTETSPGVFVYDNSEFFPIDGVGFGNGPAITLIPGFPIPATHNYLFTTEIHTLFTYKGGELFTFRGDDDLWVFINKKLAIDLGGPHGPEMESINMDARATELGLVIGQTYPMDIFHAERHTTGSNFRIETTIDFSCVVNIAPPD